MHLDLFSGIGGFAYAIDQVWPDTEHIFCDNEPFARAVLKKHWPESYIYDDIKQIDTNSLNERLERVEQKQATGQSGQSGGTGQDQTPRPFILTGGFPCQPFSQAGLRRGTADDRYLWPEMFRVIRLTKPEWVVAENVGGLVNWNEGLVLETVCSDLEAEGYEVQPFVIPAAAVNAPHRRDRVWIIGHAQHNGLHAAQNAQSDTERTDGDTPWPYKLRQPQGADSLREVTANTRRTSRKPRSAENPHWQAGKRSAPAEEDKRLGRPSWDRDWLEVATELCSVDDGLPAELDGLKLSKAQHRNAQIKAYGNAIVPQVAIEIMEAIATSAKKEKEAE